MPRTRTKYIWPPPILANDTATPPPRADATTPTITNATTTTTEPRAKKKPRIAGSRRTASSQRNTPAQEDREASRAGDDGNNQETREELVEWDPDSDTAPPSVEVVIAAYARIPMETQVKNYREWRRFGSVHEDFCMTCRKSGPESLIPCSTCSKSFHDHCLPQGSLYNERRQWFCAVCVHRNWHEQPPTLTPPASPSPEPSTEKGNPKKRSNAHLTDPEHTTTSNNSQALSILAEISRSMSRGETRHPNMPSQAHAVHRLPEISTPYSPNPSSITLPSISSRPEFGLPTPSASASAHGSGSGSILDSHARKSKFATLSSEVDSALWVLYRELESVTSLRQKIGELESEIVKLRQDVSIRDNQLILSRRSMSVHGGNLPNGISQTEIDRLRVQAAKVEEVTRQAESVRARNEALEKELQDAKAESAAKDKTLNEWKGRLVSLIGN